MRSDFVYTIRYCPGYDFWVRIVHCAEHLSISAGFNWENSRWYSPSGRLALK